MARQIADALTDAGIPFQITRDGELVVDMRPQRKGRWPSGRLLNWG
jgi:hypothetical protein